MALPPRAVRLALDSWIPQRVVKPCSCRRNGPVELLDGGFRRASTNVSSALHFYQNKQLELYAAKETKRLTLRQLVLEGGCLESRR